MRGKQVEIIEATFPTFTEDLEALREWLIRNRIQRVAMESTGVYWRPVWNILEQPPGKLELVLLNPQHVKALPAGHKTDKSGRGAHRRTAAVRSGSPQLRAAG